MTVLLAVITHLLAYGDGYLVYIPPGWQISCAAEDPWISMISHLYSHSSICSRKGSVHTLKRLLHSCQTNLLPLKTGSPKL